MIKYLTTLGFRHVHTRGSHHIFQSRTRKVVVPERKQVGRGLLLSILSNAGIGKDEFLRWHGSR